MSKKRKVIAFAGVTPTSCESEFHKAFLRANLPLRVKLINLPDSAQAVVHTRDDSHLEMCVYGYDSEAKPVQLVAPFSFESRGTRDEVFANDDRLADFAKAVFSIQMAKIDPELNTNNFKTLENNGN